MSVGVHGAAPASALGLGPVERDHLIVTLWFLVTFKQFPNDELILYPMALYFAYAFVRDLDLVFDRVVRGLVLFVFPAWWLLSASWGLQPGTILRSGVQLVLTIMICHCAAARLDARRIMHSLLLAAAFYGVYSLMLEAAGMVLPARGAFASKNAMGVAMVILWMAALCTALDRGSPRLLRLAAALACLLALRQIAVANSVTAILLAGGVTAIVLGLAMLGGGLLRTPGGLAALLLGGAGVTAAAAVVLSTNEVDLVGEVLGAFGKDTTLTGRTVLWQYAEEEIALRPLLGVGEGGFWTPHDGSSQARRIYDEFHKTPNSSFSFHNAYYEIAVHQGLIGLGLAVLPVAWCLWRVLGSALRRVTMPDAFFVCVALVTMARSVTEAGLMAPFAMLPMLLFIGALLTLRRPATGP